LLCRGGYQPPAGR